MIEQFLQTALEFIKEIWFQLDSRFDLQNTEAFKFLKPYLSQLQDNPLYMGLSLAALFLVPYALIKIKSISKERERKLDELMEEMEEDEEYDEDDPRRLRRAEPEADDASAKPLFENDREDPPSYMKVLNKMEGKEEDTEEDFESELEDFELETPSSDNEETINLEEAAEPVSSQLTDSDFEKDLNEFMSNDIDMEKNVELQLDDSAHDQAIKELQEDGELMEFDEHLSGNDPFANYSELDEDEQDQAIKDLQDEMERTINKLTEQIEEPSEPHGAIKDLSQIHIGGDSTINDEYSPEEDEEFSLEDQPSPETESSEVESEASAPPEESSPVSELSDSEILATLEPELENSLDLESMLEAESEPELEMPSEEKPEVVADSEAIPETRDYEPALFDLESEELEAALDNFKIEPEVSAEDISFAAESLGFEEEPELRAERPPVADEYVAPGETDSLIDRLKFLQTRFENRYQPVERSQSPVEKKIPDYSTESFVEPRRYSSTPAGLPPGSKKYMDLLESFIFMKDQKKHK